MKYKNIVLFFLITTITQNILSAEGDSAINLPSLLQSTFEENSQQNLAVETIKEKSNDIGKNDDIEHLNDEEYKEIFGQDTNKKNLAENNNLQPHGAVPEQNVELLNNEANKAEINENAKPNERRGANHQVDGTLNKNLDLEDVKKIKENLDTCLQQNELLKSEINYCRNTKSPRHRNHAILQQENYILRQENKQLREETKCGCSEEEPSKLKELWSNCVRSKKDLENKIEQTYNKTLQQNIKYLEEIRILEKKVETYQDYVKDMCKKSGGCTGKEENVHVEFARNLEKQQELNVQEKTKLEQLISNETGEKEKQITEKEQLSHYLKTICKQTGGWNCAQIDEKFLVYHALMADIEKDVRSNLKEDLEESSKRIGKLEDDLKESEEETDFLVKEYNSLVKNFCEVLGENRTLNTNNTNLKNKLTNLADISNKLSERNKELKTTKGALDILFSNFVDTMIQHKIKIVIGTITSLAGIGSYLFYKKANKSPDKETR